MPKQSGSHHSVPTFEVRPIPRQIMQVPLLYKVSKHQEALDFHRITLKCWAWHPGWIWITVIQSFEKSHHIQDSSYHNEQYWNFPELLASEYEQLHRDIEWEPSFHYSSDVSKESLHHIYQVDNQSMMGYFGMPTLHATCKVDVCWMMFSSSVGGTRVHHSIYYPRLETKPRQKGLIR